MAGIEQGSFNEPDDTRGLRRAREGREVDHRHGRLRAGQRVDGLALHRWSRAGAGYATSSRTCPSTTARSITAST